MRGALGVCSLVTFYLIASAAPGSAQPAQPAPRSIEVRVVVKDRSTNEPLRAPIYSRSNCKEYTDDCIALAMHEAKESPSTVNCVEGAQIYARTKASGYYAQSSPEFCFAIERPIELFFAKYGDPKWLARVGAELSSKPGKSAEAAVLLNEAFQLNRSEETFEGTLRAAAMALKVDPEKATVFDPLQSKRVASQDLVDAIKKFQESEKILVDGVLGQQTLQKLIDGRSTQQLIMEFALQPPNQAGQRL